MLYSFFWVIPRCLNFICRRFRTLCLFHLYRQVGADFCTYLPMKMEQTECSETSAYKIQTPGNYPEENIQHSEHGESLKSRIYSIISSILTPSYFIVWTAICTLPEDLNICCRTFIVSAGCPINNPHTPVNVGKYCENYIALLDT